MLTVIYLNVCFTVQTKLFLFTECISLDAELMMAFNRESRLLNTCHTPSLWNRVSDFPGDEVVLSGNTIKNTHSKIEINDNSLE